MALLDAFTKATGVKVTITRESFEDVQPKASVAANTGAGPDIFWGLHSLPHLFPQKCIDMTDVADYLGQKYGGWAPSAVAYGTGAGGKPTRKRRPCTLIPTLTLGQGYKGKVRPADVHIIARSSAALAGDFWWRAA